jgi:hypothetical protein
VKGREAADACLKIMENFASLTTLSPAAVAAAVR